MFYDEKTLRYFSKENFSFIIKLKTTTTVTPTKMLAHDF